MCLEINVELEIFQTFLFGGCLVVGLGNEFFGFVRIYGLEPVATARCGVVLGNVVYGLAESLGKVLQVLGVEENLVFLKGWPLSLSCVSHALAFGY